MFYLFVAFLLGLTSTIAVTTRSISLRNSCPQRVRVGLTTGVNPKTGGFYPSFLKDGYLDLNSGENELVFLNIDDGSMYSGAIFGSTGCDTYLNACETGICHDKHCAPNTGAVGPHTRAEFTFDPNGMDYYDISIMHGVNLPISMKTIGGKIDTSNPYSCGSAGSVRSTSQLPGCPYKFNPSINGAYLLSEMIFVAPPNLQNLTYCAVNSNSCPSGQVCGLSAGRDPTGLPTTSIQRVCGKEVGMWSADEICVYSAGMYSEAPYFCNRMAPRGSYFDLFGCAGGYSTSGYTPDPNLPNAGVCGCTNWDELHLSPTLPSDHRCYQSNPDWVSLAYPFMRVLKETCPIAYSYAYDDMTSTFTCPGNPNYEIVFCEDGVQLTHG